MNLEEAKEAVEKLAKGEGYSIEYRKFNRKFDRPDECIVYIQFRGSHCADTFEEAINQSEEKSGES